MDDGQRAGRHGGAGSLGKSQLKTSPTGFFFFFPPFFFAAFFFAAFFFFAI